MLLTADVGNTNITLGIFENENLLETFRLPSDKELPQEEYEILLHTLCKNYNVTASIIASVVDELSLTLKHAIDNVFHFNSILLTNKSNLGIKVKLKNSNEVGMDRIANACGAYVLYSKPAIIVDLGTATTFDIIDKNGDFVGGVIMPGLNMQLRALNSCTSKLPKIEAGEIDKPIGNNTKDAILSGVIRGSACAIEGLIEQCEKQLGLGISLPSLVEERIFGRATTKGLVRKVEVGRYSADTTNNPRQSARSADGVHWGLGDNKSNSQTENNCQRATIIATGGYSTLISKYMTRKFDFVNPCLTLEGLRFLYELNK